MRRKAISRPWTVEDVSALKQLAANRTPARMIALKLGRTLAAVQARASAERISLRKVTGVSNKRSSSLRIIVTA
jgi:hypothetical protein